MIEHYDNQQALKIEAALTGEDITNYLYPFRREQNFENRKIMAYYINYFEAIINSLTVPVFSGDKTREYSSKLYEAFLKDVDRKGTSLDDFLYQATKHYKAHDAGFIIINNSEEFATSKDEQIALRQFPWLSFKGVHELHSYEQNEFGELTYIKFYNGQTDETKKSEFITFTNEYIETKSTGKIANPFGFIPVISLNPDIVGYGQVDLADTTIAIYNQLSESRDLERTQAFCLLEIPNDMPGDGDTEIGPNNILWVPTNSARGAAYISPDSAVLSTLKEAALTTHELLQSQAAQIGSTVTNMNGKKSAEALGYEWQGKAYILKALSKWAQSLEYKIFSLFINITNEKEDLVVIYEKDFKPSSADIINKIDMVEKAKALGITFNEDEMLELKNLVLAGL